MSIAIFYFINIISAWFCGVLLHVAYFDQDKYDEAEKRWGADSDWRTRKTIWDRGVDIFHGDEKALRELLHGKQN